jgi:aminopeptidase N
MFLYSLTEEIFHKGLAIYLSKETSNDEGIAKPIHIYDALQIAVNDANVNIKNLFETWEHQTGYPILYVNRSYNTREVHFTQHRFTDDIISGMNSNSSWHLPITYSSKENPNNETKAAFWSKAERTFTETFPEIGPYSYLIVNTNQVGFYRVMYDDANWKLIADELYEGNFTSISPNTRAMLIDDSGVFFDKGILNVKLFLEIIKYLEKEVRIVNNEKNDAFFNLRNLILNIKWFSLKKNKSHLTIK